MLHYLTDEAQAKIAAIRAAIVTAKAEADAFAREEMDPVAARLGALQLERQRLGTPPVPDAYITAAEWRHAADQHTFDLRYCERETASTEQTLNGLRDRHHALLCDVADLQRQLRTVALKALEIAVLRAANEAADIAHVRQSFLNRIPLEQRPAVLPQSLDGPAPYQVQGSGWPDMSFFQARIPGTGFGPDKSAALAAELGLS
jgi:hypothetical protein